MKMNAENAKERLLEVSKDGYRKVIYRTLTNDGSTVLLEESDLLDFSRPMSESNDMNVFFSEKSFWRSFTDYVSIEGMQKRKIWHESAIDWLCLEPVFIHSDIRDAIIKSLAETVNSLLITDRDHVEGFRTWCKHLGRSEAQLNINMQNLQSSYRHAV